MTVVDPLDGEHVAIDRTLLDLGTVMRARWDGSKPVLIRTSERAMGKTTTARLISAECCLDGPDALVPCIVPAAELIRFVRDSPSVTDENLLDEYLGAMHAEQHHFQTPLDEIDAASRILAPVLCGEKPHHARQVVGRPRRTNVPVVGAG